MKRWWLWVFVWFYAFIANMAAADVPLRVPAADLAVESIATSGACVHGRPCAFHVIIRNQGTAPYRGPIALTDDVPALTLLAEPLPAPWTCVKSGRGQFDCRYPDVTLEPGHKLSVAVTLKVIGTSFGKMQHCGLIEWPDAATARNQAVRERLAQLGYAIGDRQTLAMAIRDVKTKVGLERNDAIDAALAASLVGPWGEGDGFAGNDRGCAPFELLEEIKKPLERCRAGEGLVNGKCLSLAGYCPGGQQPGEGAASCTCPRDRPFWSSATGQCQAAGAGEACRPGQSMAKGDCFCPPQTPVWSDRDSRCMAIEAIQFAAAASKADVAPSCTGGRILDPSRTDCVCPRGLRESSSGCVRQANTAPPSRPAVTRPAIKRQLARPMPNCPGARVWSSSLGRCVRVAVSERQCGEGRIRRNGQCIWPKRAQARKPVARKARVAARPVRAVKHCDGLTRWSATMRHCIPFWIMVP
jgi:hypothetical protein